MPTERRARVRSACRHHLNSPGSSSIKNSGNGCFVSNLVILFIVLSLAFISLAFSQFAGECHGVQTCVQCPAKSTKQHLTIQFLLSAETCRRVSSALCQKPPQQHNNQQPQLPYHIRTHTLAHRHKQNTRSS